MPRLKGWLLVRVGGRSLARYPAGALEAAREGALICSRRSPEDLVEVVRCNPKGTETVLQRLRGGAPTE